MRRSTPTAQGHANPVIDENSQAPRRTGIDEGSQQALKSLMSVAAPAPLYRLERAAVHCLPSPSPALLG